MSESRETSKQTIAEENHKFETNWAEYLDYTKNYEPAETDNENLYKFIKDFDI